MVAMQEKEQIQELLKKLKYKEHLSFIEKSNLVKKGLIKFQYGKNAGFYVTEKGKHYIEVIEREWGEL